MTDAEGPTTKGREEAARAVLPTVKIIRLRGRAATHLRGFYVRMSRSRKKTPVGSILVCGWTEKEDKKLWHQKLRTRDRRRLNDLVRKHVSGEVEELFGNFLATLPEDVSDPLLMRKEWRVRWTRERFDTELEYMRWIRK